MPGRAFTGNNLLDFAKLLTISTGHGRSDSTK
jgi:hypothetical protein